MYKKVSPPLSAVSASTGLVGVISLLFLTISSIHLKPNVAIASLILLFGTALPMVAWEVLVKKSYLRPTSGLCFSIERSPSEVKQLTYVKLIGLISTSILAYIFYHYAWWYTEPTNRFYFTLVSLIWPFVLILAPIYIYFTSRYMIEPRDALWNFGAICLFNKKEASFPKVRDHLLTWLIKIFFLAFMFSIWPVVVSSVLQSGAFIVGGSFEEQLVGVVAFLTKLLFMLDVCIGTIGYIFSLRVLDSHVVSPNKYLPAWIAALVCYPPLITIGLGGALSYHVGTKPWNYWLSGNDIILWLWAGAILFLVAAYVWATIIFGVRFSNLTNRGVITNGPYRYFKHPAYLSKNLFWWLLYCPFVSTFGAGQAAWNCMMLLLVNFVYFVRAKTEEKHLMSDPIYVEYSKWIEVNGVMPRLLTICFNIKNFGLANILQKGK